MFVSNTMSIVLLVVAIGSSTRCQAQAPLELNRNDVVVFFGGANMLRLQQAGHLETIAACHPLGSGGTNVRDGYHNLSARFSW